MSLLRTITRFNSKNLFSSHTISERGYSKPKRIIMFLEDSEGLYQYHIRGQVGLSLRKAIVDTLIIPHYGLCGGMPACTTCHVIMEKFDYDVVEPPDSLEVDLLKTTIEVTPTSRLGCQLTVRENMDGMEFRLPSVTKDNRLL